MNGRERILAALSGEPSDYVPFAINPWQWFYVNRSVRGLPLAGAGKPGASSGLVTLPGGGHSRPLGPVFLHAGSVSRKEMYTEEFAATISNPVKARTVAKGVMTSYNHFPPGMDTATQMGYSAW